MRFGVVSDLAPPFRGFRLRPSDTAFVSLAVSHLVESLGYIIPYTTRAKMLVQRLWDKKCDWDDPQLPEDLLSLWSSWEKELSDLEKISLPKCYFSPDLDLPTSRRDIHIFCDASEQAYGSVAYLRTENTEGQVEVAFLAA